MIEIKTIDRVNLSSLFQTYRWNYMVDSILEGQMGKAFADEKEDPQTAALLLPKLQLSILGGETTHPAVRRYLEHIPSMSALIPASPDWEPLFKDVFADRLVHLPRYAFSSENLDLNHLEVLKSRLPDGCRVERMDTQLANQLYEEKSVFSSDHMVNFDSPGDFIERGFGFCILDKEEIVCAATTFALCSKGIEIEISTRESHRGRGLATAAAAQLLIYSLGKDLDPNWDAANTISAGLARKLGYIPQGEYFMYVYPGS